MSELCRFFCTVQRVCPNYVSVYIQFRKYVRIMEVVVSVQKVCQNYESTLNLFRKYVISMYIELYSFHVRQTNYSMVLFFTVPLGNCHTIKILQRSNKSPRETIVVSTVIVIIVIVNFAMRIVIVLY